MFMLCVCDERLLPLTQFKPFIWVGWGTGSALCWWWKLEAVASGDSLTLTETHTTTLRWLWQLLSGEMTLLFMLPGVYISSHPVTLSYPPLQRLCLCLCLSLCLPSKMWCIQWTFTPSVFPTQVIPDLQESTWLTCVGQTQEEDWSACFASFQVTIQFRAKSQALKSCVLSHHCFMLLSETMISRDMMLLWRDVEIHDCLP